MLPLPSRPPDADRAQCCCKAASNKLISPAAVKLSVVSDVKAGSGADQLHPASLWLWSALLLQLLAAAGTGRQSPSASC